MNPLFKSRGIIVSCQAYPGDPMYDESSMLNMARAAEQGGAIGIRANGERDIRNIARNVSIPVIGLIKRNIPGSEIYITPAWEDAEAIIAAGAKIVAMDVTMREHRNEIVRHMIHNIHACGALVMADVSTLEEGIMAERLGADYVSTTLSGYTSYSLQLEGPDIALVAKLCKRLEVPVIAEGRIWTPEDAVKALEAGAEYVVVGSAITRPEQITARFAQQALTYLMQGKAASR
ncbi:N-acylglucosamine-6-phosphate 2-epimerase [Paenibacillus taihuensis]|uniref:Putative N-acetylmannosamine-6-phosphate 2-epimerase n=1 Tax=Paenibacillus taihuensis TaxID=1156355 RepID=A0A3D9R0M4_9BACL|nr:N-acetylmannosamine-6-phosphate 2-epimerase [Paenibacillus taihuensis]REE67329.1 N-acylglucosamine-6-phosphate 2-epimerase [Paenibacillus taihuensis]